MLISGYESGGKGRNVRLAMGPFFLILVFMFIIWGNPEATAAEKGPIKIGFLAPITGNFAQIGIDMAEGFKMCLDEINYTIAGRKIEFIVEDEATNPAVAVTKARKLIEHDKVNLIAGLLIVSSGYAIAPICIESETPFVATVVPSDDLTQRRASKYVMRVAFTGGQWGMVAGDYAYKKLGWRKALTIGYDYSFGYEVNGGFQRTFEEAGGKVIQKVWTPFNTMDFGPYVSGFKREVDGILDSITGGASIRFLKALRGSGYKGQIIGPGSIVDETLFSALGDDGVGVYNVFPYCMTNKTPENIKFLEKMKKFAKREPTSYMAINYSSADWIVSAIKKINGDVENKDRFIEALRSVEIPNSIRGGLLKMDKYGHIIQNMYIRRVDKVGNTYQNTLIETYPMVSQFWKYDPETYLKWPEYSRDYPPCKFCE